MERTPFARARALLSQTPVASSLAITLSIASALLIIPLLVTLGLLLDLLQHHGRIPAWNDIRPSLQTTINTRWSELPVETRQKWLSRLPLTKATENRLLSADEPTPPLDGLELEVRWRAMVAHELESRVNSDAAQAFLPAEKDAKPQPNFGILATLIRLDHHLASRPIAAIAATIPGTWETSDSYDGSRRYLLRLFLTMMLLTLLLGVCMNLAETYASRASLDAVTRLRRMIYHHSYRVGTQAVHSNIGNEAIGLMTKHVGALQQALHAQLTTHWMNPILLISLAVMAFVIDPILAVIAVILAVLVVALGHWVERRFVEQSEDGRKSAGSCLSLLEESLGMMRLVKCYLMELFNQSRVERQLAEYARSDRRRLRGETNARPNLILIILLGSVVLLFLAGRFILAESISLTGLLLMFVVLACLNWPITGVVRRREEMPEVQNSAAVVFDYLDRRSETPQLYDAAFLPPMNQLLEFQNVTVREYGTGQLLLNDISFQIIAGKRVCIVGPDDAEKLAIAYSIPRLVDANQGMVRIDGKDVKGITLDSLRSQIGLVLSHQLTFNDSVGNNIGCGDPSYSLPQIIEAAKLAHAHQFIQKLPHGYETIIGEMGTSLKRGEQFRIALARAILRDPAILIIEELPEGFDDLTRALIDDTLRRVMPGRTVLFLAHRRAFIKHAETVILVHKGRVDAVGDHRSLLETNALYRTLIAMELNDLAEPA
ncbi:ABC transporter ATP-binding protein [Tuwongella immobilis]|uniref:ABC transporter domain-containing protein n=1 Tax=Tuwongella immobilis TaxID=692036 RepID=A0A6C2YM56_9BACT|nr:ABC transporter ATP-binding protein [Tuwongella immobilis]VIP02678.1 abc transporter permease : ABC-type multidrug transport system, ATPase and permease component OS=Singulisphaera acidiphila (strain ATCC BAA-1392 / DSM 18658 / VKM B-2454 / MOB10) GN=Sinac_6108 PE=4 SV=1: ABC_membrane: ABC_tran [Tuwongella immobilis]VTS02123.1 abc transporter permease : ABC-type multidrug transport system, ATPase and permease component OS=Singulisphaera acidiphila (strain ATCC BAA-1392 / DSM 18658 / VKM B-2454